MAVLVPGKFLYLCNYRVASRSTAAALRPLSRYSDIRATERHHCTLEEARRLCAYDGELVVSTVRNPWDLLVSFYYLVAAGEGLPFEDYLLRRRRNMERSGKSLWPHYRDSQRVWNWETLKEDVESTCLEFDMIPLELPVIGASERTPYQNYYTSETRDMVGEWFADEIAAEGYDY